MSDDDVSEKVWSSGIEASDIEAKELAGRPMTSIILVEYRSGWLVIRQEILEVLGYPIITVQCASAARISI